MIKTLYKFYLWWRHTERVKQRAKELQLEALASRNCQQPTETVASATEGTTASEQGGAAGPIFPRLVEEARPRPPGVIHLSQQIQVA